LGSTLAQHAENYIMLCHCLAAAAAALRCSDCYFGTVLSLQVQCAATAAAVLGCDHYCCKAVKHAVVVMAVGTSGNGHGVVAPLKFEVHTCGDGDVDDVKEF
jgi:hypothetical protein